MFQIECFKPFSVVTVNQICYIMFGQETLTGFKWMGNRARDLLDQDKTVLFAFEEAIGIITRSTHTNDCFQTETSPDSCFVANAHNDLHSVTS